MASHPAVHHVALTVADLSVSVPWYETLFGATKVIESDEDGHRWVAFLMPNGLVVGLHQHGSTAVGDSFSEFRVGLDHLSFGCANRAELEGWRVRLDAAGVKHSGIAEASYGLVLVFRDPDNIQLEFFAPNR